MICRNSSYHPALLRCGLNIYKNWFVTIVWETCSIKAFRRTCWKTLPTHCRWETLEQLPPWISSKECNVARSCGNLNCVLMNICLSNYYSSLISSAPPLNVHMRHLSRQLYQLSWSSGFTTVAFPNTYVQYLTLDHSISSDPVKIDTGIVIQCASWSPKGSILAIGGAHQSSVQVCWYHADNVILIHVQ